MIGGAPVCLFSCLQMGYVCMGTILLKVPLFY